MSATATANTTSQDDAFYDEHDQDVAEHKEEEYKEEQPPPPPLQKQQQRQEEKFTAGVLEMRSDSTRLIHLQVPPPPHGNNNNNNNSNDQSLSVLNEKSTWCRLFFHPDQIMAMLSNFSTSYNVVNISLALPILNIAQSSSGTNPTMFSSTTSPTSSSLLNTAAASILQRHLSNQDDDSSSSYVSSLCASSLLIGMILGQLVGGTLGDVLGRRNAMWCVLILQIVASLGSSLVSGNHGDLSLYWQLAIWRLILGIGAGGVYPLAAMLSTEQDEEEEDDNVNDDEEGQQQEPQQQQQKGILKLDKIKKVALTFSTQGVGFLCVPLLTVILLACTDDLNLVWRVLLGVGCVPGIVLLVWRLSKCSRVAPPTITEGTTPASLPTRAISYSILNRDSTTYLSTSTSCTSMMESNASTAPISNISAKRKSTLQEVIQAIRKEPNVGRKLLGTAGTWFLFDVLFYGNTLFEPLVLKGAFGNHGEEQILKDTARDALYLSLLALPGYIVSMLVLGRRTGCVLQTPRYVQLQGFFLMFLLYGSIGLSWNTLASSNTLWKQVLLIGLYGLSFFFSNYGPNTTTFLLPSLSFETPNARSTLNGLSAACGKLGALTGASLFAPLSQAYGNAAIMWSCSFISLVAFLLSFVCVEE